MPSPPLYSQKPRSEPSASPDREFDEQDDDGFINRPRENRVASSRSPSPPAKRPRYDEQTRPNTSPEEIYNGLSKPSESALPRELSISILNVEPLDEFIKEIADFIWTKIYEANVSGNTQVEVEAKLGIIRDRRTGERIALPTMSEISQFVNFS
jgi:hypothetical protein